MTYATTYAFGELHGWDPGIGKVIAHGVVGGTFSKLQGGKFISGFLAAGVVQGFGWAGGFEKLGITVPANGVVLSTIDKIHNAIASAVIGGVSSVLGGGKFANGAVTGAFSRLFNDLRIDTTDGLPTGEYPDKEVTAYEGQRTRSVGIFESGDVSLHRFDVTIDNSEAGIIALARSALRTNFVSVVSDATIQKNYIDTIRVVDVYVHKEYSVFENDYDPTTGKYELRGSYRKKGYRLDRRGERVSSEFQGYGLR